MWQLCCQMYTMITPWKWYDTLKCIGMRNGEMDLNMLWIAWTSTSIVIYLKLSRISFFYHNRAASASHKHTHFEWSNFWYEGSWFVMYLLFVIFNEHFWSCCLLRCCVVMMWITCCCCCCWSDLWTIVKCVLIFTLFLLLDCWSCELDYGP